MFTALLNVPAKILLSIAGALFTLNFATFIEKHFGQQDRPIVAEQVVGCEEASQHRLIVQMNKVREEQARVIAIQGLFEEQELQAEFEELSARVEKLDRQRQEKLDKILMIYR